MIRLFQVCLLFPKEIFSRQTELMKMKRFPRCEQIGIFDLKIFVWEKPHEDRDN